VGQEVLLAATAVVVVITLGVVLEDTHIKQQLTNVLVAQELLLLNTR